MDRNTKLIIGLVALIAIVAGGVWYTDNDTDSPFDMGRIMNGERVGNMSEESDLTNLPEHELESVKPTEVVELKDGDTFDMEATIVSQEVGNRTVKRLAYNGQIPGPVLKVQKGAKVTVNFTNNIDMETSLHSHGLRGDYLMDGAVPITPAIPVGESFSYELEFPDTGVYWYHPHVREDYQQEMGLYGNMIVEEDGYWNEVDQEEYLIVDDILEDGDFSSEHVTNTLMGRFGDTLLINDQEDYNLTVKQGEITRAFITNVANTRTFDLKFAGAEMKLVGGDLGRIEQEKMIEHQTIGTAERYVIEFYYDTPGTFAIDHRGKTMGTVTVLPSETNHKAAFMTLRSNADDYADIRSQVASLVKKAPDKNLRLDIEMKGMMGNMMNEIMSDPAGKASQEFHGEEDQRMQEHCQMMPEMEGCEPYVDEDYENDRDDRNEYMMGGMMGNFGGDMMGGDEDGEQSHTVGMTDMMDDDEHGEDGIEWEDDMAMMNDISTDESIEWIIEDTDTRKKNDKINWSFKQGDLVKVQVYNDGNGMHPMQHPIHFHGQRFVVLAEDGEVNKNMQWKDTILISKGQTVDLLVDMSNPGKWMAHCHIAEHLHSGMMFNFTVE